MILNNKVAIVTGCSKGIGLACVNALLSKGVKVAGWSRTEPDLRHSNFKFYLTDVRDANAVTNSFNATVKDFGEDIHILINNAGIGYAAFIDEMPVEEWVKMFETNVNGLFYCSQKVIPRMRAIGEGHIVNIASIAGKEAYPRIACYCGTKFAVRGISEAMYKELRDYGVKVTCISPGSVQTHFFDNRPDIIVNENMMEAKDIAGSIIYALETSTNFHPVEIEVRPLMPQGRKTL